MTYYSDHGLKHLTIGTFSWISFGIGVGLIGLLALAGRKKEEELEMKRVQKKAVKNSAAKTAEGAEEDDNTDGSHEDVSDNTWDLRRGKNKKRSDRKR